jgi:predicted metal-dependent hydrolase
MSKEKKQAEGKLLKYAQAAEIRLELMNLDLSYVPKGFNTRELRLVVQENIIGLGDVLRAVEPQEKEINELMSEYNEEANALNRKYSIHVKDTVLTKEERFEYEDACSELKAKYKKTIDLYKEKLKELQKVMDTTDCPFVLKKTVKKDMLPSNISASDMAILSRLMEW